MFFSQENHGFSWVFLFAIWQIDCRAYRSPNSRSELTSHEAAFMMLAGVEFDHPWHFIAGIQFGRTIKQNMGVYVILIFILQYIFTQTWASVYHLIIHLSSSICLSLGLSQSAINPVKHDENDLQTSHSWSVLRSTSRSFREMRRSSVLKMSSACGWQMEPELLVHLDMGPKADWKTKKTLLRQDGKMQSTMNHRLSGMPITFVTPYHTHLSHSVRSALLWPQDNF